ncbi:IS110 family transposase, partial [Wolbachia endosymbiont of Leptopilina clavipes]
VSKKKFKLKSWGIKLAKKKGIKKAVVALARKLAVIMHRMLVDKTEFYYQ